MTWSRRIIEALAILVAIAVVARVVWELLGPLLPIIGTLVVVVAIGALAFRGPHANK